MTVLSDASIRERLSNGDLSIDPLDPEEQIQPTSVDLTLGNEIVSMDDEFTRIDDDSLVFEPGVPYLATTREYIDLPDDLCGSLWGRSSIGRLFIQVHTAGWIDAGFHGELTLEVVNFQNEPLEFDVGTRFCQLVFHEVDNTPTESYRDKADAKYNGQQGATESRYERL